MWAPGDIITFDIFNTIDIIDIIIIDITGGLEVGFWWVDTLDSELVESRRGSFIMSSEENHIAKRNSYTHPTHTPTNLPNSPTHPHTHTCHCNPLI